MPNSILWIAIVVLWIFVLFPMLADRHPRIRRTTDAALATRVLHRGGTRRRAKKGPGAGHETDPDWVPTPRQRRFFHGDDAEDRMTNQADEPVTEDDPNAPDRADSAVVKTRRRSDDDAGDGPDRSADSDATDTAASRRALPDDVSGPAAADATESDEDTADSLVDGPDRPEDEADADDLVDEAGDVDPDSPDSPESTAATESAAPPESPAQPESEEHSRVAMARIPPAPTAGVPARQDDAAGEPRFDDDTADDRPDADLAGDESGTGDFVPSRRGRGGYDPEADAIARATRYRFRQRTALGLVLSTLLFAAFAIVMSPMLWWACALSVVGLGAYLAYLRRQVRYEEDIRRRRTSRLQGVRKPGEDGPEAVVREEVRAGRPQGMDRDAARALRRRAVVLDVDDEEPLFDHLDPFDAAAARTTRNRAAGGEIRRAAGE